MDPKSLVIAARRQFVGAGAPLNKRVSAGLFPLGPARDGEVDGKPIVVRFRNSDQSVAVKEGKLTIIKGEAFLKCDEFCTWCANGPLDAEYLLLFFEESVTASRCVAVLAGRDLFEVLATADTPLRLDAFDLPPQVLARVDADHVRETIYDLVSGGDAVLFGSHAQRFLSAPHIIVPLFAHVMALSSKDSIDFPLILRTVAEQLRALMSDGGGPPLIRRIKRDHAATWKDVLGERIAFADGGAARISGVPSSEPLAMRVGIYSVIPGETNLDEREQWELTPYVMGDLLAPIPGADEKPNPKRLQEAVRYVLEPLTTIEYLKRNRAVSFLFSHGPLVNQFTEYDEVRPSFLPCIDADFLAANGLSESEVVGLIRSIPKSNRGQLLWNQFMAVYAAVIKRVFASKVPIVGVVERVAGTHLSEAVMDRLVHDARMTEAHAKKIKSIIQRFEISDDFLFGCILEEGEYIAPSIIRKNAPHRAREQWQEVVQQIPSPYATVLKTAESTFPFRVEMNDAALGKHERMLRLLYHTSRLLPSYAFPVGLDIVDKYAKVPDWLSRGVSARITADVLRRALATGDSRIVAQVRQFLARSPRDFFYRPQP